MFKTEGVLTIEVPVGWFELCKITGENPEAIMRRALVKIAKANPLDTAGPQEIAESALKAAAVLAVGAKVCPECHGLGLTDNHVTGEVECSGCGGEGHA